MAEEIEAYGADYHPLLGNLMQQMGREVPLAALNEDRAGRALEEIWRTGWRNNIGTRY